MPADSKASAGIFYELANAAGKSAFAAFDMMGGIGMNFVDTGDSFGNLARQLAGKVYPVKIQESKDRLTMED